MFNTITFIYKISVKCIKLNLFWNNQHNRLSIYFTIFVENKKLFLYYIIINAYVYLHIICISMKLLWVRKKQYKFEDCKYLAFWRLKSRIYLAQLSHIFIATVVIHIFILMFV